MIALNGHQAAGVTRLTCNPDGGAETNPAESIDFLVDAESLYFLVCGVSVS